MMEKTDSRLVEWAIHEVETKYRDEVSLLLEHNTYCLEQDRHVRYVNTIISDAKPFIGLARTFIINGIGYDLNQVSWDSFERDAEAKGYYTTVLAEANILYAKNEADKQRFLYLRAKLMANLANADYMYQRGLEWLHNAMEIYKNMIFHESLLEIRKAAGFISDYLAMSVACYNQTYFRDYNQLKALRQMKHLPDDFISLYMQTAKLKTIDELKGLSYQQISTTRKFFSQNNKQTKTIKPPANYQYLADWYQECNYYFRRIYYFCANQEADLAFRGMYGLQTDLDDLAMDYSILDLDVLVHFDYDNLPAFVQKLKLAEDRIVDAIKSNGIALDESASVDDFLMKNS